MYWDAHLPAKTCEAPKCVCSLYTPAHQTNWLQLLTPTLNIASSHMYVSTVIPAEVQCYITQWYHYKPEGSSWRETRCYVCILTKLLVRSWSRPANLISWFKIKLEEICTVTATATTAMQLQILLLVLLLHGSFVISNFLRMAPFCWNM